ncbi:MAG: gamma carbonic anhydrase family protein [Negativicutes bacterium]|nr:gamma carbonic anhydrase family protein [Negativicutes bacterium]
MHVYPYRGVWPQIADGVFCADGCRIIGDVSIATGASIWFNAVVRGDVAGVKIGENSNVQDNATIHTAGDYPCRIGRNVTIGHNAVVHGCVIEDDVLIGMGAVVLNGARIEKGAIVAAAALVPEGKTVKAGTLVAGVPARELRTVSDQEAAYILSNAGEYCQLAGDYRAKQ